MTVPTSDIKLSDIWAEANGPYSSGALSLNDISFFSYFAGPNGSNSRSDNNWGVEEGTGNNRIYGTSYKTDNFEMGDYSGLTYFYDQGTFQVNLQATNNLPLPTTPPDPPDLNDVNVNIELWDSTFSYQYLAGGGQAMSGGGTYGPTDTSSPADPIIFRGYWKVNISGSNPMFGGCLADLTINGNTIFTGQTVSGGPGGTTFDSNGFTTEDVAPFGGVTGLWFNVTVY